MVRDELRQRITQWEDEARRKEDKEAEERERLREGWRREKEAQREGETAVGGGEARHAAAVRVAGEEAEQTTGGRERGDEARKEAREVQREEDDRRKQQKQMDEEQAHRQQLMDRTNAQLQISYRRAGQRARPAHYKRWKKSGSGALRNGRRTRQTVRELQQKLSSSEASLSCPPSAMRQRAKLRLSDCRLSCSA